MTSISRAAVQAAICWLLVGAGLGGYGLIASVVELPYDRGAVLPAHVEVMLFGWLVQMVLGVAWWMLPRRLEDRGSAAAGEDGRGRTAPVVLAFAALNAGLALSVLAHASGSVSLAAAGRVVALVAVARVVAAMAVRVRPFGDAAPGRGRADT
jgi:hypothetical protein